MQIIDISHPENSSQVFKTILTSLLYPVEHVESLNSNLEIDNSERQKEIMQSSDRSDISSSIIIEDSVKESVLLSYNIKAESISPNLYIEDSVKITAVIYSETSISDAISNNMIMLESIKSVELINTSNLETLSSQLIIEDSFKN